MFDISVCIQARQIAEIVNSGMQPLQNMNVLSRIKDLLGEEKRQEWAQHFIRRGLEGKSIIEQFEILLRQ